MNAAPQGPNPPGASVSGLPLDYLDHELDEYLDRVKRVLGFRAYGMAPSRSSRPVVSGGLSDAPRVSGMPEAGKGREGATSPACTVCGWPIPEPGMCRDCARAWNNVTA